MGNQIFIALTYGLVLFILVSAFLFFFFSLRKNVRSLQEEGFLDEGKTKK